MNSTTKDSSAEQKAAATPLDRQIVGYTNMISVPPI
jgi:hypothetical protein